MRDPWNLNQVILAEGIHMGKSSKEIRVLAEIIVAVALGTVISIVLRIYQFPSGGEITLGGMVPIILISYRRGPKIGFITGMIHGTVQLILFPWIINPIQVIMDYILPFGFVGLAGLIKKKPTVGVVFGMFLRFISHYFSGIIFWYSMSNDAYNWGPWIYSAVYNGLYMVPETVVSVILVYFLFQRDILNLNL